MGKGTDKAEKRTINTQGGGAGLTCNLILPEFLIFAKVVVRNIDSVLCIIVVIKNNSC